MEVLRRARFRRIEADEQVAASVGYRSVALARIVVGRRQSVLDPLSAEDADQRVQAVLEYGVRSRAVARLYSQTEALSSQVAS